jgi:calcium-binding protein CML
MSNFSLSSENNLREAFNVMDLDGDGFISPSDLQKVLCGFDETVDPSTSQDMIAVIDNEGAGRVTFKDFCIMYLPCSN